MGFERDADIIEEIVRKRDPAFSGVAAAARERAIAQMHGAAGSPDREAFLLAAMRLGALAGNGHSRVIPNLAIRVIPHRIVVRDGQPAVVMGDVAVPVRSVNDIPVEDVIAGWVDLLAGTNTRQRMLSGLMMAWPAALTAVGVSGGTLRYELEDGRVLDCSSGENIAASKLYPVSDTGCLDPEIDDYALASGAMVEWQDGLWLIRIASMKTVRIEDVLAIVQIIRTQPDAGLIVDLRGNTGGDYTKTRPLLDWLETQWSGARCAVLVNGYTFSAAIVAAVLLVHRLGARVRLMGHDVGDALAFYAEGNTAVLQQSGGLFRYSSAWHDWESGQVAATTTQIVARDMVGIGSLDILPVPEALQFQTARGFVHEG